MAPLIKENGELFMSTEFQFARSRVLEMSGGDGYATM